jgi:hypothetical protein
MYMDDRIKALAAQKRLIETKQAQLAEKAVALEAKLADAFGEAGVYASSASVTLEEWPDGHTYGWLSYAFGRLRVGHRTSDDDMADAHAGIPEDERTNAYQPLASCSPNWLVRLLDETMIGSLLDDIAARLDQQELRLDGSLSALRTVLSAEAAKLDEQLAKNLERMNSDTLKTRSDELLDAIHLHTGDGLTRSSSFLESVCAEILRERGVTLPKDKSISPLVDACIDCLEWPDRDALEDAKRFFAGVKSICGGIGALRTHFGTAHGASSHRPPLDASYAMFAKNASVAVAIFLIDCHARRSEAPLNGGAKESLSSVEQLISPPEKA